MSTKIKKEAVKILQGRIEQARNEASLTQPQLAKLLGKSKTWLSFRENGKRNLYLHDLEKIAQILHKPLSWFFNQDIEKENIIWKAKQYEKIIKAVKKYYASAMNKHYTEMNDDEIDQELDRLGIIDTRFKMLVRAIPVLTETQKEKILASFYN